MDNKNIQKYVEITPGTKTDMKKLVTNIRKQLIGSKDYNNGNIQLDIGNDAVRVYFSKGCKKIPKIFTRGNVSI